MYPLLSDFWPHGKICKRYRVFTQSGFADRAIFIIDKDGIIRYKDIVGYKNVPDDTAVFDFLKKMQGG
jgi:peroxiredoxin